MCIIFIKLVSQMEHYLTIWFNTGNLYFLNSSFTRKSFYRKTIPIIKNFTFVRIFKTMQINNSVFQIFPYSNEDSNVGQRGALLAHNLFCYCANLPIIGVDYSGSETLWMAKLGMEPELNEAVNNLPFATKLKHWPINWRLGTILARIESNLSAIEYASQKTKTPQAMIQAVLFR